MNAQKLPKENAQEYNPQLWEKIFVYITVLFLIGVVSYILIRNEKISDPNFVVIIRAFLSITMAILGSVIPGLLKVDFSAKGRIIRATGAMALFVLTYTMTPTILNGGGTPTINVSQKVIKVQGPMTGIDADSSIIPLDMKVIQEVEDVCNGGSVIGVSLKKKKVNENN